MLADRQPVAALLADVAVLADADAEAWLRDRLLTAAGFGPDAPAFGALPWRLEGLRPNAHPCRRIEGLAALIVRNRRNGLAVTLHQAAGSGPRPLLAALQASGIGRGRAMEIAVNAVLPFLIAVGDERLAIALAESLPPAAAYGRLALLDGALTPASAGEAGARTPLTRRSLLAQQGALALDRDWCRRGGCGVCPLS